LTNELQKSYFTENTYEKWNKDTRDSEEKEVNKSKLKKEAKKTKLGKIDARFKRRSNLIIVKVVLKKSNLCLESIKGLPCNLKTGLNDRCIVIFIETRGDLRLSSEKREIHDEESHDKKKIAKLDVKGDQQAYSYDFDQ
jgi:hypothetical protein